jgi:tryptophanyl-tRNA synthetase
MLTGEVKGRLGSVLSEIVERHRAARASVTDEVSLWHPSINSCNADYYGYCIPS